MDVLQREVFNELLSKYGSARTVTAHPITQAREVYWAMHGPVEFVKCPYSHDPTHDPTGNGAVDNCYVCQGTYRVPKHLLFRDDCDYHTLKWQLRSEMAAAILSTRALFESDVIKAITAD